VPQNDDDDGNVVDDDYDDDITITLFNSVENNVECNKRAI